MLDIEEFVRAAVDQDRYLMLADAKAANRAYHRLMKVLDALMQRPDRGVSALLDLVDHPEASVRVWAATYLLPQHEETAIRVLESLTSGHGFVSSDAKTVLQEWRAGRLKLRGH
jgi:hypothetical protein